MASDFSHARRLGAAVSLLALTGSAALAQTAIPAEADADDVIVVRSAPLQLRSEEMVGSVGVVSAPARLSHLAHKVDLEHRLLGSLLHLW